MQAANPSNLLSYSLKILKPNQIKFFGGFFVKMYITNKKQYKEQDLDQTIHPTHLKMLQNIDKIGERKENSDCIDPESNPE